MGEGPQTNMAMLALLVAERDQLRSALNRMTRMFLVDRDAFYDSNTTADGKFVDDEDRETVEEMDAILAEANAALAAAAPEDS